MSTSPKLPPSPCATWHSPHVGRPAANTQLRRAQLVLALAVLIPTLLMLVIGIVLVALQRSTGAIVVGVLVLALCTSGITGYILGAVFLGKGANLVRVQNDFVSSVSHELRTPITSIRLLLESLGNERIELEDKRHAFQLLGREAERLELLVGRVLEISRLQTSYVFHRERIDVTALVDEALASFDALTLTTPTSVTLDVQPGLVVAGDRPTLVRALVNLLTNAWKYTGADKRIAVAAHGFGRRIEITVRDNGMGIPQEERASLFRQFWRGQKAQMKGAPGTGLGLAFVQAIVQGHRGKIFVASRPGATEFRIRLKQPRGIAALPAAAS